MSAPDDQQRSEEAPTLDRLARERLPAEPSAAALLAAYGAILDALWAQLVPLVGELGAAAIVRRGVQVAAREQALVRRVRIGALGAELKSLVEAPEPDPTATSAALTALARALPAILHGLIGPGFLAKLLHDVERALDRPGEVGPAAASSALDGHDLSSTVEGEPDDDQ